MSGEVSLEPCKRCKGSDARPTALDETYRKTANAIGLMTIPGVRDERKLIRELEKERREKATIATPAEEALFLERSLRPASRRQRAGR